MGGAVEVDARDPVRSTETSDVVLRGLDSQAAGIVLVIEPELSMARMMSWSTFVIRLSWIVGTYAREMFAGATLPVLNARLPSLAVEKADAAGVPSGMVRENWPPGTAAPTAAYRMESKAWSGWAGGL